MVDDYEDREELEDRVIAQFDTEYSGTFDWDHWGARETFIENLDHLSDEVLEFMADSSFEEMEDWANYGDREGMEEPPDWLRDMGWYDDDGEWHNPFWYHG